MNMDALTGIYVEVQNGLAPEDSRFADDPDFDAMWADAEADVEALRASPGFTGIDVPGEYGNVDEEDT